MNRKCINTKLLLLIAIGISITIVSCRKPLPSIYDLPQISNQSGSDKNIEYAVQQTPLSEDIFPCNGCHEDQEPSSIRRELVDMHEEISEIYDHDSANRWCIDCHDLVQRDSLRLASGMLLGFDESYKLCGQCHGDKLRDWKVGVHGKRIGEWNGKKEYFLCVHCHNPHSPKFKELSPEPPPVISVEAK